MTDRTFLGEFEQMVLLAVLQRDDQAFGLEVRRELERRADRSVSRGAFYTTLDRLEKKGYLTWEEATPPNTRRNAPQRRFSVTPEGMAALRQCREALMNLWSGIEARLDGAP